MRFGRALHALRRELTRTGWRSPDARRARADVAVCGRVERVHAARLVSRARPATSETIVDAPPDGFSESVPVAEAMVTALLDVRREAGIPSRPPLRSASRRATGQTLLEGLMNSELDDVDVRGTIVDVLLATEDRDEIAARSARSRGRPPAGTFRRSPAALLRVIERHRRCPMRRSVARRGGADGAGLLIAIRVRALGSRATSARAAASEPTSSLEPGDAAALERRRSPPSRRSRRRRRRRAGRAPARPRDAEAAQQRAGRPRACARAPSSPAQPLDVELLARAGRARSPTTT